MIYGLTKSYIIYDGDTYYLQHSLTDFDFFQNIDVRHESILTGKRTTSRMGDYVDFQVTDWLFMYGSELTISQRFTILKGLENQIVTFYLAGDTAITDCYILSVKPFYIKGNVKYDGCVLRLQPIRYGGISQAILSESGIELLTEDGEIIKSEGFVL